MSLRQRAHARFDAIRQAAIAELADNSPGVVNEPVPDGLCVSCIARVSTNGSHLLPTIGRVQTTVAEAGDMFLYLPDSLHVSLLGLTGREAGAEFDSSRLDRLMDAAHTVCARTGRIDLEIGAVNLLGPQWFLEVVTDSSHWVELRESLARAAAASGEQPITYADPEPMHLNIARRAGAWKREQCRELLTGSVASLPFSVTTIEVVVTDFLVTPGVVRHLAQIELG